MLLISALIQLLGVPLVLANEEKHSGCEQQVIIVPSLEVLTSLPQLQSLMKAKQKTSLAIHKNREKSTVQSSNKSKQPVQKKQQPQQKHVVTKPPPHKQPSLKHDAGGKKDHHHHHRHHACHCSHHCRHVHHCCYYSELECSSEEEMEHHKHASPIHAKGKHKASKPQSKKQHAVQTHTPHAQNKKVLKKHSTQKAVKDKTQHRQHQQHDKHRHYMARFLCHVFPEQQHQQPAPHPHPVDQWIDLDHLALQSQHHHQHPSIEYFPQKVQMLRITLAYIGIPLDVLLLIDAPPELISLALAPMQEYFDAVRRGTKAEELKGALIDYLQLLQHSTCHTPQSRGNKVFSAHSIHQLLCLRDSLAQNSALSPRIQHMHSRIPFFLQTIQGFEPTVFTAVLPKQSTSLHSLTLFLTAALHEARGRWEDFPSRIQSITRYINKHLVDYLNTSHK